MQDEQDGIRPIDWQIATWHTELKNVEYILPQIHDAKEKKYFEAYRKDLETRILEATLLGGE